MSRWRRSRKSSSLSKIGEEDEEDDDEEDKVVVEVDGSTIVGTVSEDATPTLEKGDHDADEDSPGLDNGK
jgi:hypothetical protein